MTVTTDSQPAITSPARTPNPPSAFKKQTQLWARKIHVYASMITLIVVMFFGLTGIALNHPEWTFGEEVSVETIDGEFPFAVADGEGAVQFLSVSEFVRSEHGIVGEVDSFDSFNGEGTVAYRTAGYSADLIFDVEGGTYELTVSQEGWVAVLRDLHRGEGTGGLWSWVIDLTAGFLVVLSLTGLTMQVLMRKRRRSALVTAAVGLAVAAVLVIITLA